MIKKSKKIVENTDNEELIVLNKKNGKYYGFQDSSLVIWKILNEEMTRDELEKKVQEFYGTKESIRKDIDEIVDYMLKEQLVYEKK